jgi:O-antigen ligase
MPAGAEKLARCAAWVGLVLPWVHPFSSGPDRNAWPWLISAACLAGLVFVRRQLSLALIAKALLVAALLSSAMAVLQYFGLASSFSPWVWQAGPGEGFGNLRQRNQFGSLTAIGLAALLSWLATARRDAASALPAVPAWLALLLLAAGNAASQSRTGLLAWVGVGLAFAVFCRMHERRGAGLAAVALLLPVLAALACSQAGCGAIARLAAAGRDSRIALWRDVLTLIAERPWTGWGWGELGHAHFVTPILGERFTEKLGNAHNLPLHLAVELGVPLALLLCAALVWALWRARPWTEREPWRWGAWCVLAVIGLHSLLEYPLWYGPFQMAVLLCVAGLWRTRPSAPVPTPSHGTGPVWMACGMLALVAWMALDYWRVSQPFLPVAQRSAWWADDPLGHARRSWWYRNQAVFAEVSLTAVQPDNAHTMHHLALRALRHSAEPLVIDKLLDSARLLGRDEELAFYARRYELAFPQAHAAWLARQPAR